MYDKQCVRLYNLTENVAEEMAFFISVISVTVVTWVFIKHTFFLAMHIHVKFFSVQNYSHFLFQSSSQTLILEVQL